MVVDRNVAGKKKDNTGVFRIVSNPNNGMILVKMYTVPITIINFGDM